MDYLYQNPLLHMGMIVPIERGTAQILYAQDDGVCLIETKSGAYMLSASSPRSGKKMLEYIPREGVFTFHQTFMLDDFKKKVRYSTFLENYQAVYLSKKLLTVSSDIKIEPLDISYFEVVSEAYDIDIGSDYLKKRIEDGELFGGLEDGKLIGFIGIHVEGSIGMLKVFDRYLRKGYGTALTSYAINHQISQGITPFEQIGTDNKASLAIAQKLGFSISADKVYWLF